VVEKFPRSNHNLISWELSLDCHVITRSSIVAQWNGAVCSSCQIVVRSGCRSSDSSTIAASLDWHAEEAIARLHVGGSSSIGLFSTLLNRVNLLYTYCKNRWKPGLFSRQALFMKYLFCTAAYSSDYSPKQLRTGRLIELRSPIERLRSIER
jgi:hypothetical protein